VRQPDPPPTKSMACDRKAAGIRVQLFKSGLGVREGPVDAREQRKRCLSPTLRVG
jgi:hypothetical protein